MPQRFGDFFGGDPARAEHTFELFRVSFMSRKLRHYVGEGLMHLDRILNRLHDLCSQRRRPAIPKEVGFPGQIKERHGVPFSALPFGADTYSPPFLAERFLRMMAGDARLTPVD